MGNERGRGGRQTERHSQGESKSMKGGKYKGGGGVVYKKRKTQSRVGELFFFFPNVENHESCRMDEGEECEG